RVFEGGPPELAGRPLEAVSNGSLDGWPPARVSGCTEPGLQATSPAAPACQNVPSEIVGDRRKPGACAIEPQSRASSSRSRLRSPIPPPGAHRVTAFVRSDARAPPPICGQDAAAFAGSGTPI